MANRGSSVLGWQIGEGDCLQLYTVVAILMVDASADAGGRFPPVAARAARTAQKAVLRSSSSSVLKTGALSPFRTR